MVMDKNVPVCKEERELSYFKFFARGLAPIPEERLRIAFGEPLEAGQGISFSEKNRFLTEKGAFARLGFGENEDGTAFAANQTFVPGGTVEMMDWWLPWCGCGSDLRFKIWDPEDHYFTRSHQVDRLTDSSIPMGERLWGTTNTMLEDLGCGQKLAMDIHFMSPALFGYDPASVGTARCQGIICGGGVGVVLTHKYYAVEGGLMVDSYFWIGYECDSSGTISRLDLPAPAVPLAKLLYSHSIREMTNMAAVMPEVYAEQKDNL